MIADSLPACLPDRGLPGLGQDLCSPAATASRARQQCAPPFGLPLCRPVVHGLDRYLDRAATSTRSRPSTSAAPPAAAPPPARPATTSAHPPPAHSHTVNEPEPKAFRISRKSIRPDRGCAARGSPRTGVRVHALPSEAPDPVRRFSRSCRPGRLRGRWRGSPACPWPCRTTPGACPTPGRSRVGSCGPAMSSSCLWPGPPSIPADR